MKNKKISVGKLSLNKQTVANLNNLEMYSIKGGGIITNVVTMGPPTVVSCIEVTCITKGLSCDCPVSDCTIGTSNAACC